jgi:simple sugar transport system substrate-binding protein
MYKNLCAAVRGLIFTFALLALAMSQAQTPLKAAFVYVAPLTETGWVRQHESGRQAVEAQLNANGAQVTTTYVENVAEGADAERVIRDLARQGNQIIFTPSFGYMEPTLRVAAEYPNVKFESITGYKRSANVATANARYYEGRYLAGIAAGRSTRTGILGYVAGFPIPEVLQGLNAFTLGARSVRPDTEVRVIWLQAWFDPARERDAAMTLMNQDADVLAFHTGSNAVMIAAQERGKMAVAYHSDMRKVAPDAQLLAVTHLWGDYYTRRVRALMENRWQSTDTWGGVREGMVRVEGFGPKLSATARTEILTRQADMAKGSFQVFKGPILDHTGRTVVPAGQSMTDEQILGMKFMVQGVR